MKRNRILTGDAAKVLRTLPAASFDGCLTDPPYGLSFMGKEWDKGVPSSEVWSEVLRVLKPGAFLLAFGGTRTYHRLTCAIEDAGFEIRDCMMWLYGSGFPKSHNLGKAIDKTLGAQRKVIGTQRSSWAEDNVKHGAQRRFVTEWPKYSDEAATPEAQRWSGYGTALKPAWEPIIVAMKPTDGTFAQNALRYGVAGLNIDGCRIGTQEKLCRPDIARFDNTAYGKGLGRGTQTEPQGRWPANLILCDQAAELLDQQSGELKSGATPKTRRSADGMSGFKFRLRDESKEFPSRPGDSGGASRFFYVAKPSRRERGEGNIHPTVKPIKLAEHLAKLILPAGDSKRLLVPFSGSGSEMIGARNAGWRDIVGIELSTEYKAIAKARLAA